MDDTGADDLDDLDPSMPIGMFSRACLVSVKALRSYHDQGLLVPDSVDATTGYRYYRVSQLNDAVVIKRLRDLDVGLADISEVLRARDPEVTRKVIAEHEREMQRRLADVTRMVEELQESLALPSLRTPVHVRVEPATHVLAVRGIVEEADYASFLGDAFGAMFGLLAATGTAPAGPSGALYPPSVDTTAEPVTAFVPVSDPHAVDPRMLGAPVVLDVVPEATCAVMTHIGSYSTIHDTYRRLGAWVARHARHAELPVREHYVVSVDPATGALLPDGELRTEISWPVLDQPTNRDDGPDSPDERNRP